MTLIEQFREFLRAFHEQYPGGTSDSLRSMSDARGRNSYAALADAALEGMGIAPRVLELGCGDGVLLAEIALKRPHASLTGIDMVESDLNLARQRMSGAVFHVADFTTFQFEPHAFDVVVSHLVLMLSGPLDPVLERVRTALVGGGTFAFVVDDINSGPTRFADLIDVAMRAAGTESATVPFRPLIDRRLYDREALSVLLKSFDLTLTRFEPHVLRGALLFEELWEMLRRMYQIGTMSEEQRTRAKEAVAANVGSGACSVTLPFELAVARRDT